ncbi:hypothetical protein VMCG_06765 [Cytospora schulzeri]|uniref:Protein kinase domain-containing protein n=1 Tax=Cytospora schulzeri TaxID=448051 RepID=A0A423W5Z2_9PEZI|nr:hypothetical protein VMCG_06765 [Valsa malicola]
MALHHDNILHAILASSATSLLRSTPDDKELFTARQNYFISALQAQRQEVARLTVDNAEAVCFAALFISITSFAMLKERSLHPYQPPMEWLQVGRGAGTVIWQSVETIMTQSKESDHPNLMVVSGAYPYFGRDESYFSPEMRRSFEGLLTQHLPSGDDWNDEETRDAYEKTLSYVGSIQMGINNGEPVYAVARRIQAFALVAPPKYIQLLGLQRPRALVILAHFWATVAHVHSVWWLGEDDAMGEETTAKREIRAIKGVLPPEWPTTMVWPLDVVTMATDTLTESGYRSLTVTFVHGPRLVSRRFKDGSTLNDYREDSISLELGRLRRVPSAGVSRESELRSVQRETTDYFNEWRAGRAGWYDRRRRRDNIARIVHPRAGQWPGHVDLLGPDSWPPVEISRQPYIFSSSLGSSSGALFVMSMDTRDRLMEANNAVDWIGRRFKPARFRFRKRLGYGGCGVAALFEMVDRRGRAVPVVVKTDLKRDRRDTIRKEKENMISMAGAKHIVQRILLQALPESENDLGQGFGLINGTQVQNNPDAARDLTSRIAGLGVTAARAGIRAGFGLLRNVLRRSKGPHPVREPQTPRRGGFLAESTGSDPPDGGEDSEWTLVDTVATARRRLDNREDIIVMDYVRRGDLATWISKMNDIPVEDQGFGEKTLWLIFECLYRGCIAMAYPGAFQRGQDPRKDQIPMVTESIPEDEPIRNPMVHMDLDPQNIFVGEFDRQDHQVMPSFKIADLGLSERPKGELHTDDLEEERYLWSLRRRGKRSCYLPEQTSEEWDYVHDLAGLRRHQVAGNFGAASNVFHVGVVMWQLITLCQTEVPMLPREYQIIANGSSMQGWTGVVYGVQSYEEADSGATGQYYQGSSM